MNSINITDDLIRTMDLWCWKRPLYQLSHNHCPIQFLKWDYPANPASAWSIFVPQQVFYKKMYATLGFNPDSGSSTQTISMLTPPTIPNPNPWPHHYHSHSYYLLLSKYILDKQQASTYPFETLCVKVSVSFIWPVRIWK